jgi:2-polyprenyl-3-methyl-5-hydroxy-6-metoxy-1,4-benzoquinol methylase
MVQIAMATTSTAVTCPVCSAGARSVLKLDTVPDYSILRCSNCRLVFSSPRPNAEELDQFYSSEYFQHSNSGNGYGYADYSSMADRNAHRMWKPFLDYTDLAQKPPLRLLDVGCGTGGFLAEAKAAGWNGTGIELSQYAVDVANKELGLKVYRSDIFSNQLQPGSFDVVTMWHVLEHLIDPLASLRRAHDLLADDGVLFVELPNWDSAGRVFKGAHWKQLKPPEHINFFTTGSIAYAAREAGFTVGKCSTHYPSLADQAAVKRPTRPIHMAIGFAASIASAMGCGGYLRLLAHR